MMTGWIEWNGKKIFVRLKSGKVYSGKVVSIDKTEDSDFFTIIDKFGKKVSFVTSSIVELQEEK